MFIKEITNELLNERNNIDDMERYFGTNWNRQSVLKIASVYSKDSLKSRYSFISMVLGRRMKEAEVRTHAQIKFESNLCKKLKHKYFINYWIGPYCVDFFIPSIASEPNSKPRMVGLVIEIDGPVHNIESKMSKDEDRGNFFKKLGIGLISISNEEVNDICMHKLIENLNLMTKPDFRSQQRVFKTIYMVTVVQYWKIIKES